MAKKEIRSIVITGYGTNGEMEMVGGAGLARNFPKKEWASPSSGMRCSISETIYSKRGRDYE